MSYAEPGRPSRIVRPDGSVESIGYDERGNPVEYTEAGGGTRLVERSLTGAVVAQTDADGRRVTVATNAAGLPCGSRTCRGTRQRSSTTTSDAR